MDLQAYTPHTPPAPPPTGAPARRIEAWTTAAPLLLVAAVGSAAYANSFGVPFQFDDILGIARNPAVSSLSAFLRDPPPLRPVAYLTFAFNGSIGGQDLFGLHLFNLLIHLGVAAAVYGLASLLVALTPQPAGRERPWNTRLAGLAAGALFVAHPVHTQAVTYLTQRMASLAALFFAGAVLAYGHAALATSAPRRRLLFAAGLACAPLAVLTKENTVVLPAVLLAFDRLFLPGAWRDRLRRVAPSAAATGLAALWLLWRAPYAEGVKGAFLEWSPIPGLSPAVTYLLAQPAVVLRYVGLMVAPIGQNLDYDFPVPAAPLSAATVLPTLVLAAIAALLLRVAARSSRPGRMVPVVAFALAWFSLGLLVESSVIPLADLIFEHRVYLPAVGVAAAAGVGLAHLYEAAATSWARRLLLAAFAGVVLLLAGATWQRNRVWRDPVTLWSDVLAKSPGKARPYVHLAEDAARRGDHAQAVKLLRAASGLPRVPPHVHMLLAMSSVALRDLAAAEAALREQDRLGFGDFPGTHLARGLLSLEAGRIQEACGHFEREVELSPASVQARENRASCRFMRGDAPGAVADWEAIVTSGHPSPRLHFNLGLGYAALGDTARARASYEAFLSSAQGPPRQVEAARAWLGEHPR